MLLGFETAVWAFNPFVHPFRHRLLIAGCQQLCSVSGWSVLLLNAGGAGYGEGGYGHYVLDVLTSATGYDQTILDLLTLGSPNSGEGCAMAMAMACLGLAMWAGYGQNIPDGLTIATGYGETIWDGFTIASPNPGEGWFSHGLDHGKPGGWLCGLAMVTTSQMV